VSERKVIDLDAERIKRAREGRQPPILRVAGRSIELPSEIPAIVLLHLTDPNPNKIAGVLQSLLGDAYEEILPLISLEDFKFITQGILTAYDADSGEASASTTPSEVTSGS
jgi:hypothetical protein